MEHAPERNQIIDLHAGGHSPLHKTHINVIGRVGQSFDVIQRPLRRKNLKFHAVASQYLAVLLGIELEDAAVWAAGDRYGVGWRGTHEPVSHPDHYHGD